MTDVEVEVKANTRSSVFCPVNCGVDIAADELREMALVDEQRGAPIPFQVEQTDADSSRVHWIVARSAAGQRRRFTLTERQAPAAGPLVDLTEEDDRIQVKVGGEFFTCYHFGDTVPRPFLYPMIGPYGAGVTRPYPIETVEGDHTDHPHHRSVWVAWGDVNGSDNWSEGENSGTVEQREMLSYGGGAVYGWVETANDWVSAEGAKLMEDRTLYRFYNLPGGIRFVELDVEFTASEGDVRFGDTKEGGICSVRVAAPMEVDRGGCIQNSFGGVNEPETWGKRAQWCDYNGVMEGHRVGVAILDHPKNYRHPTYWHVRNYGLMTANPFGLSYFRAPEEVDGSYELPAGETVRFRYGIYVHAGDAEEGAVGRRYLDWIHPPQVTVME